MDLISYTIGFMMTWLSIMQIVVHKQYGFIPFAIIGIIIAVRARIKMKK